MNRGDLSGFILERRLDVEHFERLANCQKKVVET
jgi:hypothetical protein